MNKDCQLKKLEMLAEEFAAIPKCSQGGCSQDTQLASLEQIKQEQYYVDKLRSQRQKIQAMRQDFEKMGDQLQLKDCQLQKLKDQLLTFETIKSQAESARQKFESNNYQITRLKKQRAQLQENYKKIQKENQKELAFKLRQEINNLKNKVESQVIQNNKLRGLTAQTVSQRLQLQNNFEQELNNFKERWNNLKNQLNLTAKQGKLTEQELKKLKSKKAVLIEQINQIKLITANLEKQNQRVGRSIEQKHLCLQKQNCQAEEQFLCFKKELSSKAFQLQKLSALAQKQQNLVQQFKKRYKELEIKQNKVNGQLQSNLNKLKFTQKTLKEQDQRIVHVQGQIEDYKGKLKVAKIQYSKVEQLAQCLKERQMGEHKVRSQIELIRNQLHRQRKDQLQRINDLMSTFRGCRQK